jgi:hypothetical protein
MRAVLSDDETGDALYIDFFVRLGRRVVSGPVRFTNTDA